jgi:DNA repair ATPase RecN
MESSNQQIRIESIRIENVFGVRELEFSPDGVTVIRGDNDTGKTSVLRAINQLLGGGHNRQALRKGADKGEVRFVLDDGTEVYARLTENDTYYRIDGDSDLTARQLLESIQDEISVNPIQILQARPQDRGQILLEAMPMRLKQDSLSEALSPLKGKINVDPPSEIVQRDAHALEVLGDKSTGLIGTLYEQRQEMHGAKRDKQGTVSDLEQSVEQHKDPEELKDERDKVQKDLQARRQDKQEALDEVDEWEKEQIEKIRDEANEKREEVREHHDPIINGVRSTRERIQERIEQAEKAEQTKDIIEERRKELAELEDRYGRLSEAIDNLRDLRTDFADDLPGGVEVDEDGEIVDDDDIRFENWNEERQVRFAARIAEMRAGRLKLIPIDGIEKLVGDQREAFIQRASESDAQYILTEAVAGEKLTINHA